MRRRPKDVRFEQATSSEHHSDEAIADSSVRSAALSRFYITNIGTTA